MDTAYVREASPPPKIAGYKAQDSSILGTVRNVWYFPETVGSDETKTLGRSKLENQMIKPLGMEHSWLFNQPPRGNGKPPQK